MRNPLAEYAWALVPQDPDFGCFQRMTTPVLQCLEEALRTSMGDYDPLRIVILGILATRDLCAPVEMIDMMGNVSQAVAGAGLTQSQIDDLVFLVHDKDHILVRGRRHPSVEAALRKLVTRAPVLYRGLYDGAEMSWLSGGGTLTTSGYTSFSERPEFARKFAGKSRTLLCLRNGHGFNYSGWLKSAYDAVVDPRERAEQDLDFMVETCEEEREWIIGFPVRLTVVSDGPGRGALAGYRVVTVSQGAPTQRTRRSATAGYDPGIEVVPVRTINHDGWVEHHEMWSMKSDPTTPAVPMRTGRTPDGHTIGNADDARYLVETLGIVPEPIDDTHSVCTIGRVPAEGVWAGWSHRARAKFPTRREAVRFALSVASAETAAGRGKRGPCWKGYTKVGTKTKNGRRVPNCVPNKSGRIAEESVIHGRGVTRTKTLKGMLLLEVAASDWFSRMSPAEQKAYTTAHPGSKFNASQRILTNRTIA